MTTRSGKTGKGARAAPGAGSLSDEEKAAKKRNKRISQMVASLPADYRKDVRAWLRSGFTPIEVLETGSAILSSLQARCMEKLARDVRAYEDRQKEAAELERAAARAKNQERKEALLLRARELRLGRLDIDGAVASISALVEKARRVQDSLAVHRPSGHTRVQVTVVGGGDNTPDPAGNNYVRVESDHDDLLEG